MTNELLSLVGVEEEMILEITQQGWAHTAPGWSSWNGPPGLVPDSCELLPLA